MFWFDKLNPDVLFVDNRRVKPTMVGKGKNARMFECNPDQVMDFRNLNIKTNSFYMVVFDPPHFIRNGKNSWTGIKYGTLDRKNWRDDIAKGLAESFRVLKKNGVLIFKWNETDIPLSEVLKLTPYKPLFGHPSGKMQRTHWVAFIK